MSRILKAYLIIHTSPNTIFSLASLLLSIGVWIMVCVTIIVLPGMPVTLIVPVLPVIVPVLPVIVIVPVLPVTLIVPVLPVIVIVPVLPLLPGTLPSARSILSLLLYCSSSSSTILIAYHSFVGPSRPKKFLSSTLLKWNTLAGRCLFQKGYWVKVLPINEKYMTNQAKVHTYGLRTVGLPSPSLCQLLLLWQHMARLVGF